MKVIALADLHYNITRCKAAVREQAAAVVRTGGDVLIMAGDTASMDLGVFEEALALFEGFGGRKLLVPGNHDIWVGVGGDSRKRYEFELPDLCRRHGFDYLDAGPVHLDGVAFVGALGWYDYTFRDEELNVPQRFYEAKVGPGAAEALRRYQHLLNGHADVTDEMKQITAVWRDGTHVSLGASDAEFTAQQARRLGEHLAAAARKAEQVVAVVHTLPLREMAPDTQHPNWRFARAFLGSTALGDAMAGQPKLRYVLAGHSHYPWRSQRNGTTYINIGSGYHHKRMVTLAL